MAEHRFRARLERLPQAGLVDLRGGEDAVLNWERVLGAILPRATNQMERSADIDILCLAPDQWLLRVPCDRESDTAAALESAAGSLNAAVTVVSDAYAAIRLTGEDAPDVLAQGCPLDLHALTARHCARTLIARAGVLVVPVAEAAGYELWVDRSYADYVALWLETARGGRR